MNLTLKAAIRRLNNGQTVCAQWYDGKNQRARIVQIKKTPGLVSTFRLRTINDETTEQLTESRVQFDDGTP